MISCTHALVLTALALMVALTYAHPTPENHDSLANTPAVAAVNLEGRIKKRSASRPTTEEEIAALKELILESVAAQMAGELPPLSSLARKHQEEQQEEQEQQQQEETKRKRMYAPLSGLPGELPTIKRQIRYHQCYFNPISCFRRK